MKALTLLFPALLGTTLLAAGRDQTWMNPKIGFTGDFLMDVSDVEEEWQRATSQGVNIRSAELILGASIDPYAELTANVNFGLEGAELHELFAEFPVVGRYSSLAAGWKLANFGRWNQFHTHAMPFTAEPRIYHEYIGGHLQGAGAELSILVPLPFYLEATLSVYDDIHGHSHDNDPSAFGSPLEQKAAALGLSKHGNHWHAPDGGFVYEHDLIDPEEPSRELSNRPLGSFPVAGRLKSSVEFGNDLSLDIGGSALWQQVHRRSNRIESDYAKGLFGADATLFWHPLSMNKYRNFDLGVEWLLNYEEVEQLSGTSTVLELGLWRQGVFGHLHYQHNERWHFGAYGELFEAQEIESWTKKRAGLFATLGISHYQYLRLEGSTYEMSPELPPVHRLTLQYDVTIGFHSHGTQR